MSITTAPVGAAAAVLERGPRFAERASRRPRGRRDRGDDEGRLRVAMLAPPWISVPPPGYGGVESVVSVLTEALVRRGNEVTLFCAPGSESSAQVVTLLDEAHPDEIERSLYEVDHVAQAFAAIERDARRGAVSMSCTITVGSRPSAWQTVSPPRSCTRCTDSSRRPLARSTTRHDVQGDAGGDQPRPARDSARGPARRGGDPEPNRRAETGRCRSARRTTCSGSAG